MKKIFLILAALFAFQFIEAQPTQCFTAIHCDPSEPENFPNLEKLVDSANSYNIKLTIEFTGPWVDSISPYLYRKNKIAIWHAQGHEIAMHHHDISHPMQWDGYTNHSKAEILAAGWDTNNYKGNMEYLYNRVLSIAGTAPLKTIGNSDSVDLPLGCIFQTQGILPADGFSNPVSYSYDGKNYCRIGYTYISGLSTENLMENLYPSMTAYNSLGVVFHVFNFVDDSWPMMKWFQFVNQRGLQSKMVAQILISLNCPPVVGLVADEENHVVQVYPNPFALQTTIEIISAKKIENAELKIFDMLGREIISTTFGNDQKIILSTNKIDSGVYFYKVFQKNKVIATGKLFAE